MIIQKTASPEAAGAEWAVKSQLEKVGDKGRLVGMVLQFSLHFLWRSRSAEDNLHETAWPRAIRAIRCRPRPRQLRLGAPNGLCVNGPLQPQMVGGGTPEHASTSRSSHIEDLDSFNLWGQHCRIMTGLMGLAGQVRYSKSGHGHLPLP